MFHRFKKDISHIELPKRFTCPFCYSPHLLSIMAANELQSYVRERDDWADELRDGKMFGVLVVRKGDEIGFVASFSGQIQGQNLHEYFVPPVYDLVQEGGFFKQKEAYISSLNERIEALSNNDVFRRFEETEQEHARILAEEKRKMDDAKKQRDAIRKKNPDNAVLQELIRESQFQKAEYKRLCKKLAAVAGALQIECDAIQHEIDLLKEERKERSQALQQEIFEHFVFLNANGEEACVLDLFDGAMPPSGAGECAAPRLLQYAYRNHLQPIAMAEFWWGKSPKHHIRRHGSFYSACKQKCAPILGFMLQGLDVEENRFSQTYDLDALVRVVYEDEWLVIVDKPIDVLSVPGNIPQPSVWHWAREKYGEVFVVHRLDMATSGILLIAKSLDVCRKLQCQFENRLVHKKYVAILDGEVRNDSGEISLPMRPDFDERPIQVVDFENGKQAVTRYEVLERGEGKTRVAFFPKTGRTHQLRVHSAHPDGLDCPILGDSLYGRLADRMYLHAEQLTFMHPILEKELTIRCDAPF
ncbi:MAG: RNA pseudouridine synthase [Bacteroidales bacterium]|nr:RNA pseudouridine synthase [Bacteroidales bacterium]